MGDFDGLDRHLIARGLEPRTFNFDRESVVDIPNDDRLMLLIQQGDNDVPTLHGVELNRRQPNEEVVVAFDDAALQRDIAEFAQSRHFDR